MRKENHFRRGAQPLSLSFTPCTMNVKLPVRGKGPPKLRAPLRRYFVTCKYKGLLSSFFLGN